MSESLKACADEGVDLFNGVLDDTDSGPPHFGRGGAWMRWRKWAYEASDMLDSHGEPLDSLATLWVSLARQDVNKWADAQRNEIMAVLTSWQANPKPSREDYESWDDRLVDAGVHVRPW